jgi:hypothetical protein
VITERARQHAALLLLGALLVGGAWLATRQPASAGAATAVADPVIVAAGDIACDPTNSSFNGGLGSSSSCRMKYTSDLIDPGVAAVLLLGDNQY